VSKAVEMRSEEPICGKANRKAALARSEEEIRSGTYD